jgi:hypothetical protein
MILQADSAILCAWRSYATNTARLGSVVEGQKAARASDLEQLAEARRVYLKRVEESVAFVREQGVHGTTKVSCCWLQQAAQQLCEPGRNAGGPAGGMQAINACV